VRKVIAVFVVVVGAIVILPHAAGAAASGTDSTGGSVTVTVSGSGTEGGEPGGSSGSGSSGDQGPSPWVCVSTLLTLNDEGGFAPGGPTPGSWYSVTCTNESTGASTTQTEWIPDQSPTATATATPAVDPYAVALQAEDSLRLPDPAVHLDPQGTSVVNLPTWLWIDADVWHPYAVTASVGTVSATAVATPISVTWTMGDGGSVSCDGPGTPYDPAVPSSQQSTPCQYAYAVSSFGQPSPDGNPDDDSFAVVASINWSVTWSVAGGVGGGTLPTLSTTSSTPVRVEQVESVDTAMSVATT
jgi:hypothetical protein